MLEVVGMGLTAGASVLMMEKLIRRNDRKIMEEVFYRQGCFYKKKDYECKPRYKRKDVAEWGTRYVYTLPYGLPFKKLESAHTAVEEALRKEVEMEFANGVVLISVYEGKQVTEIQFDEAILTREGWSVPLGLDRKGEVIWFDITKGLPHLLIGGATGGGKSSILRVLLTSLVLTKKPHLYLLDMKGGVEFGLFERIEGVQLATTLSDGLSMTSKVITLMNSRYTRMRELGVAHAKDAGLPPMFVCCDELADLNVKGIRDKDEKALRNAVKHNLSILGAKGRAANVYLILSTQSPRVETIDSEVKTHMQNTIGFRVRSTFDSEVIMGKGNHSLSEMERIPGRVILQGEEEVKLQTFHLSYEKAKELLSPHYQEVQDEQRGENTFIIE